MYSEPCLYQFIGETDTCYHKVDARLHHQVMATDHQAAEVVCFCQEMAKVGVGVRTVR